MSPGDLTFTRIHEMTVDDEEGLYGEVKSADWPGVIRECETALAERSKDLELAAILTQARAETSGFEGMKSGLVLVRSLLDAYWSKVHPGYDEEDDEIILGIRGRPLTWLGTSDGFLRSVKRIPITAPSGNRRLTWFDYEETERVDQAHLASDRTLYNELREQDRKTSEEWLSALAATPPDELSGTVDAIRDCRTELEALRKLCDEKFEDEPPNLMKLEDLLGEMRDYLAGRCAGSMTQEASPEEEGIGDGGDADGRASGVDRESAGARESAGPIATRAEAIRRLRDVAGFLRRTEPHSPISFLVERAAKWGDMSFEQVMRDIMKDSNALDQMWETLGIGPPEEDDD